MHWSFTHKRNTLKGHRVWFFPSPLSFAIVLYSLREWRMSLKHWFSFFQNGYVTFWKWSLSMFKKKMRERKCAFLGGGGHREAVLFAWTRLGMTNYLNSIPFRAKTDVYVSENVIPAGTEPTRPLRDVVSSWHSAAHSQSGFGRRRRQIRFRSSVMLWNVNAELARHQTACHSWPRRVIPVQTLMFARAEKGSLLAMLAVCNVFRLRPLIVLGFTWQQRIYTAGFLWSQQLYECCGGGLCVLFTEQTLILWSLLLYCNKYI